MNFMNRNNIINLKYFSEYIDNQKCIGGIGICIGIGIFYILIYKNILIMLICILTLLILLQNLLHNFWYLKALNIIKYILWFLTVMVIICLIVFQEKYCFTILIDENIKNINDLLNLSHSKYNWLVLIKDYFWFIIIIFLFIIILFMKIMNEIMPKNNIKMIQSTSEILLTGMLLRKIYMITVTMLINFKLNINLLYEDKIIKIERIFNKEEIKQIIIDYINLNTKDYTHNNWNVINYFFNKLDWTKYQKNIKSLIPDLQNLINQAAQQQREQQELLSKINTVNQNTWNMWFNNIWEYCNAHPYIIVGVCSTVLLICSVGVILSQNSFSINENISNENIQHIINQNIQNIENITKNTRNITKLSQDISQLNQIINQNAQYCNQVFQQIAKEFKINNEVTDFNVNLVNEHLGSLCATMDDVLQKIDYDNKTIDINTHLFNEINNFNIMIDRINKLTNQGARFVIDYF